MISTKTEKKIPQKIEPEKYYSLQQVVDMGVFPDVISFTSIRDRVIEDLMLPEQKRVLKALKVGDKRGTRYLIVGRNLIEFLKRS
jgi:uncharacterized protein YeaC (DUF1315 family)